MCPVILATHQELGFPSAYLKIVSLALKDFALERNHLLTLATLHSCHIFCLESNLSIPTNVINYATFLSRLLCWFVKCLLYSCGDFHLTSQSLSFYIMFICKSSKAERENKILRRLSAFVSYVQC